MLRVVLQKNSGAARAACDKCHAESTKQTCTNLKIDLRESINVTVKRRSVPTISLPSRIGCGLFANQCQCAFLHKKERHLCMVFLCFVLRPSATCSRHAQHTSHDHSFLLSPVGTSSLHPQNFVTVAFSVFLNVDMKLCSVWNDYGRVNATFHDDILVLRCPPRGLTPLTLLLVLFTNSKVARFWRRTCRISGCPYLAKRC